MAWTSLRCVLRLSCDQRQQSANAVQLFWGVDRTTGIDSQVVVEQICARIEFVDAELKREATWVKGSALEILCFVLSEHCELTSHKFPASGQALQAVDALEFVVVDVASRGGLACPAGAVEHDSVGRGLSKNRLHIATCWAWDQTWPR